MKKEDTQIIIEPGKQELFIIRELNAPREMVFKAYTDPELYVQWVGPLDYEMILEKFEPKSGGEWRYIETDSKGNKFAFHGVIHEVSEPERIIDTFEYEGLPEPGHVILQTAKFEELPEGKTRVTAQAVFQSVEDRDEMIKSGMENGMKEGFERLDKLLDRIKSNLDISTREGKKK